MALLEKLTHLEEQINKFLALHDNPYDSSAYDAIAEKMRKLLPALHKATASDTTATDHTGATARSITASVGVKGENKAADVRVVQTLLEIVVDGDCGPKTKNAIKDFQRQNDIKPVSGLVEPAATTWNKLAGVSDNTG